MPCSRLVQRKRRRSGFIDDDFAKRNGSCCRHRDDDWRTSEYTLACEQCTRLSAFFARCPFLRESAGVSPISHTVEDCLFSRARSLRFFPQMKSQSRRLATLERRCHCGCHRRAVAVIRERSRVPAQQRAGRLVRAAAHCPKICMAV